MKTFITTLTIGIIVAAFIAGFFYGNFKPVPQVPQQLTLEQILSIKQLHLVKHTYNDLFYLHKQNNPAKAIRAIAQVPVEVTAYLDLKEVQIIWQNDSIRQLVLPRARLNDPHYKVEHMVIRETRSFHVYAGKDLYPKVGAYLQQTIASRVDTIRHLAVANRILAQAEQEGREFVLTILRELGHGNIDVIFVDEQQALDACASPVYNTTITRNLSVSVEAIPFGFIPMPR